MNCRPDISIVVPAYNAEQVLPRSIGSVLEQTYERAKMELIVVNDCSSDGTASVLEEYRSQYPDLIVAAATEERSGSPSEPRNRGLQLARGEYVFFLDADDWLGNEAVECMLGHARSWGSDMLLVKPHGENGRSVPQSMFKASQPKVNVYHSKVLWTFGPYKLFKRSLVKDLRFPPFMPEDISFVLRAYVAADTVSVAADYDYCHIAYVEGSSTHASLSSWDDVESNLEAYEDLFGFIAANIKPRDRNGVLMRRLFGRDVCNTLRTIALEEDIEKAQDQLLRLTRIVGPFYRPWRFVKLSRYQQRLLKAAFGS